MGCGLGWAVRGSVHSCCLAGKYMADAWTGRIESGRANAGGAVSAVCRSACVRAGPDGSRPWRRPDSAGAGNGAAGLSEEARRLLLRPFSGTFATLPRPWPQVFSRARRSMYCPFCQHADTRVIDSRVSEDGATIRRRRECEACNERFSTLETVELKLPAIVKNDGTREAFDQRKVRAGFDRALQKRAVPEEKIEAAVRAVVHQLRISGEREVPSIKVGEFVMNELRKLDHVGYVRFASVYRSFEDVADFREEIEKLERELPSSTEQLQLLGDVIALTKKKKG
ncbi:hypothetical protein G6F65_013897 [Rhizopus arrhizus]|nr:hypothetical protein G6F65_013897 [Rhizopus arrhizus]